MLGGEERRRIEERGNGGMGKRRTDTNCWTGGSNQFIAGLYISKPPITSGINLATLLPQTIFSPAAVDN
jgi:hypothetical protein